MQTNSQIDYGTLVTLGLGGDRYPYMVIDILPSGSLRIKSLLNGYGHSDHKLLIKNKRGHYVVRGEPSYWVAIGRAEHYLDPSM